MSAPTRQQLLTLYRQHLATSRSFVCTSVSILTQASYNFREYFVRRTKDVFRAHLYPESSEVAQSVSASAAKLAHVPTAPAEVHAPNASLAQFYEDMRAELRVLQRAAVTNMMYAGERLVVEDPARRDWIVRSSNEAEGAKE